MSNITNILASVLSGLEPQDHIDVLLRPFEDGQRFGDLAAAPSEHWGSGKRPECSLFGGAFNWLDWESLVARIESIGWTYPEAVQVFAQGQDDETFALWSLRVGRLHRLVDPLRLYT